MEANQLLTWTVDFLLHGYFPLAENHYNFRATFRFHQAYRNLDLHSWMSRPSSSSGEECPWNQKLQKTMLLTYDSEVEMDIKAEEICPRDVSDTFVQSAAEVI